MKIFGFLLFVVLWTKASAQQPPGCLPNSDFEDYCPASGVGHLGDAANIAVNCGGGVSCVAGSRCLGSWRHSHGSPQVMSFGSMARQNVLYMWGGGQGGEGVYIPYSTNTNSGYRVKMRILTTLNAGSGGSNGRLLLRIAKNVSPAGNTAARDIPKAPGFAQQIYEYASVNNVFTYVEFFFTALGQGDFLTVHCIGSTGRQFNAYIDSISICGDACQSSVSIINTGLVPTSVSAGQVIVGSTSGFFGSGVVQTSQNAQTYLQGASQINFEPEFQSTLTTGSLLAEIVPCGPATRTFIEDPTYKVPVALSPEYDSSGVNNLQARNSTSDVQVFPNPATDVINIQLPSDVSSTSIIEMINSAGTIVFQKRLSRIQMSHGVYKIRSMQFPKGVYILHVKRDSMKSLSTNIVIQ